MVGSCWITALSIKCKRLVFCKMIQYYQIRIFIKKLFLWVSATTQLGFNLCFSRDTYRVQPHLTYTLPQSLYTWRPGFDVQIEMRTPAIPHHLDYFIDMPICSHIILLLLRRLCVRCRRCVLLLLLYRLLAMKLLQKHRKCRWVCVCVAFKTTTTAKTKLHTRLSPFDWGIPSYNFPQKLVVVHPHICTLRFERRRSCLVHYHWVVVQAKKKNRKKCSRTWRIRGEAKKKK